MTPEAKSDLRGKRYNLEKRQGKRIDLDGGEPSGQNAQKAFSVKTRNFWR